MGTTTFKVNQYCNKLKSAIGHIVDEFIKRRRGQQRNIQLLGLSGNFRQLIKQRDYCKKSFLKTQNDTEKQPLYKMGRQGTMHPKNQNYYIQVLSHANLETANKFNHPKD